jgi:hypothetical protein
MVLAETSSVMSGIGTNPGLFFSAADNVATGAEIVYGSSYLGGKAVRGKYNGQKIMETDWQAAGILNNIVLPTVYIEGDAAVTGASSSAIAYVDGVRIDIFKRLPGGKSNTIPTSIYNKYIPTISNQIGSYPHDKAHTKPCTQPYWFDIRYEYKLIMYIDVVNSAANLDIEGIYLRYHTDTSIMAPRQYRIAADDIDSVPMVEGILWGCTTDSAGKFDVQLGSEYINGSGGLTVSGQLYTKGSAYTGGGQRAVWNSIDSINTTIYNAVDSDRPLIVNIPYPPLIDGGLHVDVMGFGFSASTAYQFYTTVVGWTTTEKV